jgi:transcriptional regulatory protein LevR
METAEKHREEYAFCMKFAAEIEKEFQVRLSMDEVVFITLFLTEAAVTKSDRHKPTILIAMHGDSTASSMAKVVNDLAKCDNVYAFDMPLSMDMHEAYEELEKKIRQVDDGEGILIIYDMGSIKTMTDMISKETGIEIRTLEMPATLLAMEGSRKATSLDTLDELYDSVLERYQSSYISLAESYRRHVNPKIIITLCMSGHGGAVQMKNYLEKYLTLDDVDIVPIATNDKKFLLDEVNRIRQDHEILYVIGTYDPTLHGIPFIPVTQLFETPVDKLDILLSLKNVKFSTTMDYDIIYQSMAEEMPELNINLLKRHLPRVMEKIRKIIRGFTEDQEVGLFMHIASAIYHQILHEEVPENTNRDAILSRNKRLYNDLRDILKPLENAFDIQFSNDELSYMISIIKQI